MNATDTPIRLTLARLPKSEPTEFHLQPGRPQMQAIRDALELLELRKLRFVGTLMPEGGGDWRLEAMLGATAIQPCAVTLAPVTTRIDIPVQRRYLANFTAPTDSEAEMPEDDSIERLPEVVDLMEVVTESLAIALPDFPRAEGAELETTVFADPDAEPLNEEVVKPFAGLAALKKSLES